MGYREIEKLARVRFTLETTGYGLNSSAGLHPLRSVCRERLKDVFLCLEENTNGGPLHFPLKHKEPRTRLSRLTSARGEEGNSTQGMLKAKLRGQSECIEREQGGVCRRIRPT